MNKSKIYFASSIIVNTLLLVSELLIFFNPNGMVYQAVDGIVKTYLGLIIFIAPFVLLPFTMFLLLWGLWLVFRNKLRNWLVVTGIIACLALLLVSAVLVQIRFTPSKCGKDSSIDENGICRYINQLSIELVTEATREDLESVIKSVDGIIIEDFPLQQTYRVKIPAQTIENQERIIKEILDLKDPKIKSVYPIFHPL